MTIGRVPNIMLMLEVRSAKFFALAYDIVT